jgi:hypothetical protein
VCRCLSAGERGAGQAITSKESSGRSEGHYKKKWQTGYRYM